MIYLHEDLVKGVFAFEDNSGEDPTIVVSGFPVTDGGSVVIKATDGANNITTITLNVYIGTTYSDENDLINDVKDGNISIGDKVRVRSGEVKIVDQAFIDELKMKNSYKGIWISPGKRNEFMSITDSVRESQFISEDRITAISLPRVTSIGDGAFNVAPLRSISLPKVQTIGSSAFSRSAITSLTLPEVRTLGENAFGNVRHLTSISLPKVTSIGSSAFHNSPLTYIYVPLATTIEINAFRSTVDQSSTTVTMQPKFNNDRDKRNIFGYTRASGTTPAAPTYSHITFNWTSSASPAPSPTAADEGIEDIYQIDYDEKKFLIDSK